MAVFDTRNDAEYGLGLSATLAGATKAEGDWIDMQGCNLSHFRFRLAL